MVVAVMGAASCAGGGGQLHTGRHLVHDTPAKYIQSVS
jgi:hypothetical protein